MLNKRIHTGELIRESFKPLTIGSHVREIAEFDSRESLLQYHDSRSLVIKENIFPNVSMLCRPLNNVEEWCEEGSKKWSRTSIEVRPRRVIPKVQYPPRFCRRSDTLLRGDDMIKDLIDLGIDLR